VVKERNLRKKETGMTKAMQECQAVVLGLFDIANAAI
jgi:hypothetical protein